MTLSRRELKKNARAAMHETRPRVIWVTLVLLVILLVLELLSESLNGYFAAYKEMFDYLAAGEVVYVAPAGTSTFFGWLLTLILDLMSMVLGIGFILYCMRVSRKGKAGFGDLFDSFGMFFRCILVRIVPIIFMGLWAIPYMIVAYILIFMGLPLLGPVVALPLLLLSVRCYYNFRLAPYLMLDNPKRGWFQCVMMSREVMQGHRWELFVLDLSFIGWYILCIVPFVYLWVRPYLTVTRAGYYDMVMGDYLKRMGQTAPPVEEPPHASV